uniref:Uncharacterized protein n=1 Tax=mine drainage metagenome TaxID=410659 RepID=E6PK17_9ZZZZ
MSHLECSGSGWSAAVNKFGGSGLQCFNRGANPSDPRPLARCLASLNDEERGNPSFEADADGEPAGNFSLVWPCQAGC